jgi:hypothetical protein
LASCATDFLGSRRQSRFAARGDHDAAPLGSESARQDATEAAASARDQYDRIYQSGHGYSIAYRRTKIAVAAPLFQLLALRSGFR